MSAQSVGPARGIVASWVLAGEGDPIRAGAVVVDAAGRVIDVGSADALRAAHAGARWESLDAVLLPGLVNAHTHLELSALRGRVAGGQGFVPWLRALQAARASAEDEGESVSEAVAELVALGTAAVGEVTNTLAAVPALAQAPLVACVFHEIYGVGARAAEGALAHARAARREAEPWPANVRYSLAPHGPYGLHPGVLRAVAADARERGVRSSMHLSEHAAERRFLATGDGPFAEFLAERGADVAGASPSGADPVTTAARLDALGPHVVAVHLTDARDEEIAQVAAANAPVVLCPRSNLHIHLRLPPLPQLLAAGIRPGLGTDSLASAPSLDVLDEAVTLHARFPTISPSLLVSMVTAWGADALGLGDRLGRLAPGLAPGVVAFAHVGPAPADPARWLVSRARGPRSVVIAPGTAGEAAPCA